MEQKNYFADLEVAARYERYRPYFHQRAVTEIVRLTGRERFARALDVGCGTGKSSLALAEIADEVVAIDVSSEMLSQAPSRANITYKQARAEESSAVGGEFDLITVGAALHWFEAERFFSECRKVLAAGGVVAVYNDHFTAHMKGDEMFKRWVRRRFLQRYRRPAQRLTDFEIGTAVLQGFRVEHEHSFEHLESFTREQFAAYLLTHSNTLSVVENGRETLEEATAWLVSELQPFMGDGVKEMVFKCNVWVLAVADRR